MSTKYKSFWSSLSKRLGLNALNYPIPIHAQSLPYMLGGLSLAAFGILFISGIYLAQFYNPNQIASNQSVLFLITQAPFGNFARSVHFWTSNIAFILILFHLVHAFLSGNYKRPREFTWIIGLGLLAITMAFIFLGTMLTLGQEGIEALEHSGELGMLLGKLGFWLTAGFSFSLPLIGRMYVAHMSILPILFIIFIIAHFYLIKIHGISPKASRDAVVGGAGKEGEGRFGEHIKKLIGWSFILLSIISLLALIYPESLGSGGLAGIELTKPPWMFLWIYGMENVFGITSLLWGPFLLFSLLAAIPLLDRSLFLSPRRRIKIMIFGSLIFIAIIALSINAIDAGTKSSPKSVQTASRNGYFISIVYAHNMPFLSFSPVITQPGEKIFFNGDGLKSGEYNVYLKGPKKSIVLGIVKVNQGDDSFHTALKIPNDLPGDMYAVKITKNISTRSLITKNDQTNNKQFTFFAPLQLAVQPYSSAPSSATPINTRYPIPQNELPWIVSFIIISLGAGIFLLTLKKKKS